MSWGQYHNRAYGPYDWAYGAYLGAEHRPTTRPLLEQPRPQPMPLARRHHFHDHPPYPHRYYNDYALIEGRGWWPRWFPYWDQGWITYWWNLYDYYGGDAYPEYAEYARDAYLRQNAPKWGLVVSGNSDALVAGHHQGQAGQGGWYGAGYQGGYAVQPGYGYGDGGGYAAQVGWSGPVVPVTSSTVRGYDGLEEALIDGLSRRAIKASAQYSRDPSIPAVAYLRLKGGQEIVLPYPAADWLDAGSPIRLWWNNVTSKNYGSWEFCAIVAFDPRTRQSYTNSYALSPVIVGPLSRTRGGAMTSAASWRRATTPQKVARGGIVGGIVGGLVYLLATVTRAGARPRPWGTMSPEPVERDPALSQRAPGGTHR